MFYSEIVLLTLKIFVETPRICLRIYFIFSDFSMNFWRKMLPKRVALGYNSMFIFSETAIVEVQTLAEVWERGG